MMAVRGPRGSRKDRTGDKWSAEVHDPLDLADRALQRLRVDDLDRDRDPDAVLHGRGDRPAAAAARSSGVAPAGPRRAR